MVNPLTDSTPRLFAPSHATTATAIGGPLAGAVVMAANYRKLARPSASVSAILSGALASATLVIMAWKMPPHSSGLFVVALYTGGLHVLARWLQGSAFDAHIAAGGTAHSAWRAAGVGLGCLALTFLAVALALFTVPPSWLPAE